MRPFVNEAYLVEFSMSVSRKNNLDQRLFIKAQPRRRTKARFLPPSQ